MHDAGLDELDRLTKQVASHISEQREQYRAKGSPLSEQQWTAMAPYFSPELLGTIRVVRIDHGHLEKPTFYLVGLELIDFEAFELMAAVTFVDTIVAQVPLREDILFHELVHAEQYRQLGIARFASLYTRGYLQCGGYHAVPLELHAYELDARSAGEEAFFVASEVETWIAEERY